MNLMRAKSNFAFGLTHTPGALQHSKAIKIQCGGLFGLRAVLDHTDDSSLINDISALIRRARRRFGELGQLPYDRIMRAVIHYQHRKPLRRNKV